MSVIIAAISDVHYDLKENPERPDYLTMADKLFRLAVERVNSVVRPDVTLLLGDLVDGEDSPDALACLRQIRAIADEIVGPVIAIPGNHDPAPETFYEVFDKPTDTVDVAGVRFLPFVDADAPDWNACRSPADIQRMIDARRGFDGPIVSVQHVPLFAPGTDDCPYNFTNTDEILPVMAEHGIRLAISGHYHRGTDVSQPNGLRSIAVPALCDVPFRFCEIVLDEDDARVCQHVVEATVS
jgi:3',5'-cyclic AMP phosphodiesterase CpdA